MDISINKALIYINNIKLTNNSSIVFDIDNTLIDKYGNLIRPVKYLYDYVKSKNINIFIVTARESTQQNILNTKLQLLSAGITGYKGLYLRHSNCYDISHYKEKVRYVITQYGYNIIMSIGDQLHDIGKYGGYGILLPII